MNVNDYKFVKNSNVAFVHELRNRVNQYFSDNNISKYGNFTMYFKTVCMITFFVTPYALMLSGVISNPYLVLLSWILMGIGMAGIGLSVMHDANHGAYSPNKTVNKWMSYIIFLVGGNQDNWLMQHNRLHHTFTNVEGLDVDIDSVPLLRFSPHKELKSYHKNQYIFAWFLYGLLTVSWMTIKDFSQLFKFREMGLITSQKQFNQLMTKCILGKLFYYIYIVVLPLIFINASAWIIVLGIFLMNFVAGVILSTIFQLAHVMPETAFPLPNEDHDIENNWAVHQLFTTANFAPKNKILSWYCGGLNFQVEHHLFPQICHIHYNKLSPIIAQTAAEYNIPYFSESTFRQALGSHVEMLKKLGTA